MTQRQSPTALPRPASPGSSPLGPPLGSGGLLQRRQQTFLGQVGLQRVEDVELLVHAERQELLDDLGGVGTPGEENRPGLGRDGGDQPHNELEGHQPGRSTSWSPEPRRSSITFTL